MTVGDASEGFSVQMPEQEFRPRRRTPQVQPRRRTPSPTPLIGLTPTQERRIHHILRQLPICLQMSNPRTRDDMMDMLESIMRIARRPY